MASPPQLISHLSFLIVPYSSSPISHPPHLASLITHLRSPTPSSFISHIPSCISHLSHLLPPILHLSSLICDVPFRQCMCQRQPAERLHVVSIPAQRGLIFPTNHLCVRLCVSVLRFGRGRREFTRTFACLSKKWLPHLAFLISSLISDLPIQHLASLTFASLICHLAFRISHLSSFSRLRSSVSDL